MADLAIIGGGIVGMTIARDVLAATPERTVVVLDRDGVGSGASRRSAGLHIPRGATPALREMAAYSQAYWLTARTQDPSLPIHPVDMTVHASATSALDVARRYGPATSFVPAEAGGARPEVSWRVGGAQYADVYALTQHLARAVRERARVVEGQRVVRLDPDADGVDIALGSGETLRARHVVLAPGPWIHDSAWRGLLGPLGLRVKQVVALHVERPVTAGAAVQVFEDDDSFLLPLGYRGHWLFSYTSTTWDVDPDAIRGALAPSDLAAALAALARRAPDAVADVSGARVFCDAYSPDRAPVVAPLDPAGRIVFAGAANGSGYRIAPAIAARTAALVTSAPTGSYA